MPPPPPGGGAGGQDHSAGILWGVAAIFAFIGGVWYMFHNQIVQFYLMIKLYELNIVKAITGSSYTALTGAIEAGIRSPGGLNVNDVLLMGSAVGDMIRWPFVILMIIFAFILYFGNTGTLFRSIYSMNSLAKAENSYRPFITPVVGLDLLNEDIDKGRWAMAMTPMQFCKRYRLLQEVKPQVVEGARVDRDRIDVVLRRGRANRLFIMQLGPLWYGPDKLPPYARALFAAFAARLNADKKGSELLAQLAASSKSKLNYKGTDELIKKHYSSKGVQKIVNSHAYVLTVMAQMLEGAREDGVQASADFLWLKPMDRRLWYVLNTVGRSTPFVEVAGVFAHWVSEKEAGTKLMVPMIEEATNALELALKEVVYKRDE